MTDNAPFCEHAARDHNAMETSWRQLLMEQAFRPQQRELLQELFDEVSRLSEKVISLEARIADGHVPRAHVHRTVNDLLAYVADKLVTSAAALKGRDMDERYVMGRQIVAFAALHVLRARHSDVASALNRTKAEVVALEQRAELRRRGTNQFTGMLEMVIERFSEARRDG